MQNLIDKLYDLHLPQSEEDSDNGYKTLLDKVVKLESEITKCSDCKEIFDEFQTANGDLHSLACRREFRRGFRTGAQLVLEMMGRDASEKAN